MRKKIRILSGLGILLLLGAAPGAAQPAKPQPIANIDVGSHKPTVDAAPHPGNSGSFLELGPAQGVPTKGTYAKWVEKTIPIRCSR